MTQKRQTQRSSALKTVAAGAALAVVGAGVVAAAAVASADVRVTICHRSNSTSNPYVLLTVARSSVDGSEGRNGGQGDHFLNHTGPIWTPSQPNGGDWGDIIPPIPGVHGGLNWTAKGQAIWAAGCTVKVAAKPGDSDRDGVPNVSDPDDDNDGTPDTRETDDDNDGTPDVRDPDADVDGDRVPDSLDPNWDQDRDGTPDVTDRDDDNDGVPDTKEKDTDGDGIADGTDRDDDNDGKPDVNDRDPDGNGTPDVIGNPDSDRDGAPDATDRDDDSDGVPDSRDPDSNGDGIRETETQFGVEPKPGTILDRGVVYTVGRTTTDMGRVVTAVVNCRASARPGIQRAGDITAQRCIVRRVNGVFTLEVVGSVPNDVSITWGAGAVADAKGVRFTRVYRVR